MDRVQILINEITARMGATERPCAAAECIRPIYELAAYLPQLEGEQQRLAAGQIERMQTALQAMSPPNREACLTHLLLAEVRHYALMVLQLAHLRNREFADLLHSRDALHFLLAYWRETGGEVGAEEALVAKHDARLRDGYLPRFDATLQHYQGLMPLDESRWWWYLDRRSLATATDLHPLWQGRKLPPEEQICRYQSLCISWCGAPPPTQRCGTSFVACWRTTSRVRKR